MKRIDWIAVSILAIGIGFHLYRFGQIPTALNRDEAALGYNAYAIVAAGTDEWGNRLPVTFRSFGDYKLGGYIYFLSFFVRIFGVHDWVIRLPSLLASFGILAVTYGIVLTISKQKSTALLAAAMVIGQPWEIFYGRMAFEAHLALWLLLTSIYCWIQKKTYAWFIGIGFFMAAVFTYNTPLLLIPVLFIGIVTAPILEQKQKWIIASGMLLIGIAGGIILQSVTAQKQAVTIMSDPTVIDMQAKAYTASHTVWEKIWNYKEVYWLRLSLVRLIQSWSPAFLTIRAGQNPWHSVPEGAHFYWTTYLLFLAGLGLMMVKRRWSWREKWWFWWLMIGSLLPAIITIDAPHATRSLWFFWLVAIIAGITLKSLPKKIQTIFFVAIVIESCIFGWRYFGIFSHYRSSAWPVGLRNALQQTKGVSVAIETNGVDVITDQIYIYPLLYWQIPPQAFISTVIQAPPDIVHMNRVIGFENFSTSRYNQASASAIIERYSDGSYALK